MLSFRFQTATFLLVVLLVLASGRETQKRNTVLRREPNKIKMYPINKTVLLNVWCSYKKKLELFCSLPALT